MTVTGCCRAATTVILLLFCFELQPCYGSNKPTVVVIGAGAAGLAATQRLLDSGYEVHLLEATDRVGGRIASVSLGKGWIELGGELEVGQLDIDKGYATDLNKSVEYQFLQNGEVDRERTRSSLAGIPQNYNPDLIRHLVPPVQLLKSQLTTQEKFIAGQTLSELYNGDFGSTLTDNANSAVPDMSIGSLLEAKYSRWRNQSLLPAISDAVYDCVTRSWKAEFGVDSLFDLGYGQTKLIDFQTQRSRSQFLKMPFSEYLTKYAPNASSVLHTNMFVTSIQLDSTRAKPMVVQTLNGVTFSADHIIVTVSLGYLKSNLETLFKPALSRKKQMVIQAAGFGNICKILVIYEKRWWRDLFSDLKAAFLLYTNSAAEDKQNNTLWTKGLAGFTEADGYPNALQFSVRGRQAKNVEALSDQKISADLTELLGTFFADVPVPKPLQIYRMNWTKNQFFQGTHSYFSTNFDANGYRIQDLAAPDRQFGYNKFMRGRTRFVPGLLFAGEATHPEYFSLAHGALLSGIREANRLNILYS